MSYYKRVGKVRTNYHKPCSTAPFSPQIIVVCAWFRSGEKIATLPFIGSTGITIKFKLIFNRFLW